MKRIFAVILCLICSLFLLVSCGNEVGTDTDGSQGNNTDNQGHTHTFKTNEEWSKDAQGHWYEATCDCEDVTVTKLNHTDANNDGACDVCTYTNHEHEYSEDWTADCTNHWHAADCGHTVAGINVAEHEDKDNDGKCDVCKYIIEDLHKHIYSTEWTSGDGYHWHDALCEHKLEVMDKAACTINDAGVCTECNAVIKEIDKTDILAVLKAAIANNSKVTSGNVLFSEIVFGEKGKLENKGTDKVFFVLGNNASYILLENYDKDNVFIGGEQQYFERVNDDEVFGIVVVTGANKLEATSGDPVKLSGYNYTPGSILAAGYDDTATLSQTLANLYDLMVNGENISNKKSGYDEETGKYTFSFTCLSVNETEQHAPGSDDVVMDYQVYLYNVNVEFSIDDNFVITLANFSVESYRNWEMDVDLTYDPETKTATLLDTASPTWYTYEVSQISGERTYTTIYPKAAFMPADFELSYVTKTDYKSSGQMYVKEETHIVDVDGDGIIDLVLKEDEFVRLHLGAIVPTSAIPSLMNTEDLTYSFVNLEGKGSPWGESAENYQTPHFSSFMDCIAFNTQDAGKYLVTLKLGMVEKQITITIESTPIVVPPDTDDTKYVAVTEAWGYEDTYTFTAKKDGKYTFTLPAGLGFVFDGADMPEYDPFDPNSEVGVETTVTFTLNKDESITFAVGAMEKGVYAIKVSVVASDFVELEGSGTANDPYIVEEAGDYVCMFPVQSDVVWYQYTVTEGGYVTVSTNYGEGGVIKLGSSNRTAVSNAGSGEAVAEYFPANSVIYIGVGNNTKTEAEIHFSVSFEGRASDDISDLIGSWRGEIDSSAYELTINADGTGTLNYISAYGMDNTITYVAKIGTDVIIGYNNSFNLSGTIHCTYVDGVFTCVKGISNETFVFTSVDSSVEE